MNPHENFEQNKERIKHETNTKTKSPKSRETSEERKIRREKDRLRIAAARVRETVEQRSARLAIERERKRTQRARESSDCKQIRNAKNRMRQAINRANETFEETQARKINDRIRHMELRSRETLHDRQIRLAKDRARHRKYRNKLIKKETNSFCAEISNNINNQVQWLRLRESRELSSQSTNKIEKEDLLSPEIEIKEESIDIDDESVFEFTAQETKIPCNIKSELSDFEPFSDSIHDLVNKNNSVSNNIPTIKIEDNFIGGNIDNNQDPLN